MRLYDVDEKVICLVVLVTFGVLDRNARTEDALAYFENVLGGTCDDCPALEECAFSKLEA